MYQLCPSLLPLETLKSTHRSGDTEGKSPLFASVVWMRNEAVRKVKATPHQQLCPPSPSFGLGYPTPSEGA
jgi:hypothetical protein